MLAFISVVELGRKHGGGVGAGASPAPTRLTERSSPCDVAGGSLILGRCTFNPAATTLRMRSHSRLGRLIQRAHGRARTAGVSGALDQRPEDGQGGVGWTRRRLFARCHKGCADMRVLEAKPAADHADSRLDRRHGPTAGFVGEGRRAWSTVCDEDDWLRAVRYEHDC